MSYKVDYRDLGVMDYKEAWDLQTGIFDAIVKRKADISNGVVVADSQMDGTLLFLEHPHVYTLGKSGKEENLLVDSIQLGKIHASFFRTNRGGDITYHGPGQLVGYPIIDLDAIGIGLKEYVHKLEEAIIISMGELGIVATRYAGGTGVWIDPEVPGKARKICAIGVRSSRYVTMHGFALNINTDLSFFNRINPCGFTDKGVTSVEKELGNKQDLGKIKQIVRENLIKVLKLNLNFY